MDHAVVNHNVGLDDLGAVHLHAVGEVELQLGALQGGRLHAVGQRGGHDLLGKTRGPRRISGTHISAACRARGAHAGRTAARRVAARVWRGGHTRQKREVRSRAFPDTTWNLRMLASDGRSSSCALDSFSAPRAAMKAGGGARERIHHTTAGARRRDRTRPQRTVVGGREHGERAGAGQGRREVGLRAGRGETREKGSAPRRGPPDPATRSTGRSTRRVQDAEPERAAEARGALARGRVAGARRPPKTTRLHYRLHQDREGRVSNRGVDDSGLAGGGRGSHHRTAGAGAHGGRGLGLGSHGLGQHGQHGARVKRGVVCWRCGERAFCGRTPKRASSVRQRVPGCDGRTELKPATRLQPVSQRVCCTNWIGLSRSKRCVLRLRRCLLP